ncbi:hypothetical protein GCM10025789_06590 [Tessaracoccus lubricantis]|uniref:Zeta toxin domain-containing protein n=1 Tax=Tessaracoccus lubricantis TaxID=545543 RepID=A0ABP9F3B5_9ACTN
MEMHEGLELELIWSLATGGSAVAADPKFGVPDSASGPPAAGVQEASHWLLHAIEDAVPNQRFLFLVGGPGGGKSQAAARIVARAELSEIDPQTAELAHRTYRFQAASRGLTLINDATIASGDEGLAADIRRALEQGDHLLACVNRGILADAISTSGESAADALVRWLATGDDDHPAIGESFGESFLRLCTLSVDGITPTEICVVFVDNCSLLEERPEVRATPRLTPERYRIQPFAGGSRLVTPAGTLFKIVATSLIWDSTLPEHLDPVRANLTSLQSGPVLDGHLQLLRAAEITNGERLTYREVWGAIARALFSDLPMRMSASEAPAAVAAMAPNGDPQQEFHKLQELSNLRSFIGLYGGLEPRQTGAQRGPVLRFTSLSDPLLDVRPGLGGGGDGWASPVLDAFSSTALGGSPLESLEVGLPAEATAIVQSFDRTLDRAFIEFSASARPADRRAATAWYGRYLARMYAAALGFSAFQEVLLAWTDAWRRSPSTPDPITGPLRTLLSPRRHPSDANSNPVVPMYASRTEPILGHVAEPLLGMRADMFQFNTEREGESLHLNVLEAGEPIGSVLLDFDLLREAMTCSQDWLGLTEAREKTEPRVERFRSRRLVSSRFRRSPKVALEYGMNDDQLSLEKW